MKVPNTDICICQSRRTWQVEAVYNFHVPNSDTDQGLRLQNTNTHTHTLCLPTCHCPAAEQALRRVLQRRVLNSSPRRRISPNSPRACCQFPDLRYTDIMMACVVKLELVVDSPPAASAHERSPHSAAPSLPNQIPQTQPQWHRSIPSAAQLVCHRRLGGDYIIEVLNNNPNFI